MRSSVYTVYLAAVLVCFGFTVNNDTKISSYIGHAYDLKSNKPIYDEFHDEEWVGGKHVSTTTLYKDPKGTLMGSRKLTFSSGQESPGYRLDVKRHGYYEGATPGSNGVRIFHFDCEAKKEVSKTLNVPAPYVIDGGFNYFIKRKWDAVVAGKIVSFNFVVPARLDYYKFRVRKVSNLTEGGKAAMLVVLEPDNFVLRSIIDPIKITYDLASHRIIKYEGISNIPGSGDRNLEAKLLYPKLGA